MSFRFDDDQIALADGVESLLAARATGAAARAIADGVADWADLWLEVAELGVPIMAAPEESGGLGVGPVELIAVCERLGRHLVPGPVVATAGGSDTVAVAAGPAAGESLRLVVEGKKVALAYVEPTNDQRLRIDGGRLVAEAIPVPDATRSDLIAFLVREGGGDWSLAVLPSDEASVVEAGGFDRTRPLALVTADTADAVIAPLPRGEADLAVAYATAAAELVGIAQRMLELSVEHAKEREQFGTPIGAFQAVKHKLSDALLEIERARSLTYRAAAMCAERSGPAAELRAAHLAKAAASDAATEVGRTAVQVHGGLGITVEHDISLFYLRGRQAAMAMGGRDFHYREA